MLYTKKIAFWAFFLILCSNLHAGKGNRQTYFYNQIPKKDKKINYKLPCKVKKPSKQQVFYNLPKKQPHYSDIAVSQKNKAFALFLVFILFNNEVVYPMLQKSGHKMGLDNSIHKKKKTFRFIYNQINDGSVNNDIKFNNRSDFSLNDLSVNNTTNFINNKSSESFVKLVPVDSDQLSNIYGPCRKLSSGEKICCDIKNNYEVVCYMYPKDLNSTEIPSVRFDIEGIIGDNGTKSCISGKDDLQELKKNMIEECKLGSSPDTKLLNFTWRGLKKIYPKRPLFIEERFWPLVNDAVFVPIKDLQEDIIGELISDGLNRFGIDKGCLKKNYYEEIGDEYILFLHFLNNKYSSYAAVSFPFGYFQKIIFAFGVFSFNKKWSQGIAFHEFFHVKQSVRVNYYANNEEAEADLGSVLASGHQCLAFFLYLESGTDGGDLKLITKENINEKLLGSYSEDGDYNPHPVELVRVSFMLQMHKNYEVAIQILKNYISKYYYESLDS